MKRLSGKKNTSPAPEEVRTGSVAKSSGVFEQLEQQVDYLREIHTISKMVNSTLDLDAVLQTIVEMLPRSLKAQGCTIRLLSPETGDLVLAAASGLSREYLDRGEVVDEQNTIRALQGEPVAIVDVEDDERVIYHEHMGREGIRSLLAVPIKGKDEVIGIIRVLARQQHHFTAAEINFSLAVAEVGGAAISNAGTYRKISRLFDQIAEHEKFLGNIVDSIGAQMLVIDRQRQVIVANRAFRQANHLKAAEVLGMKYSQICQAQGGEQGCPVEQVLQSGQMACALQEKQAGHGSQWYERTATPMLDAAGSVEYVVEIIRDITAERQLEAEQAERSKLEGVVEMAGAVAHEISSPLFAALGTAQLLEEDFAGSRQDEDLKTIIRNLKVIAGLTTRMTEMTGYRSREYAGETRIINLA